MMKWLFFCVFFILNCNGVPNEPMKFGEQWNMDINKSYHFLFVGRRLPTFVLFEFAEIRGGHGAASNA